MILWTSFEPDEPEDSSGAKSQYISKKDWKWIAGTLVVLGAMLTPVYLQLRDQSNRVVCQTNLKNISTALQLYATQNDDRFPPAYEFDALRNPAIDAATGAPVIWASHLGDFVNKRTNFYCPVASEAEKMPFLLYSATGSEGSRVGKLTYGFYAGLSAMPVSNVRNPNEAILITETSNNGANGTYNPFPFRDENGNPLPNDGFLIGWNDNNRMFSSSSSAVTRLAFSNTANGDFGPNAGKGRHPKGNNAITVGGGARTLRASDARVRYVSPNIQGIWATAPEFEGIR